MGTANEIFDDMNLNFRLGSLADGFQQAAVEAKRQLFDAELERIGRNEPIEFSKNTAIYHDAGAATRNKLRAKLRQSARKFYGFEEGVITK